MMINVQVEILISYSIFFFTFSRSLDKDEKFHPININLHSLTLFKTHVINDAKYSQPTELCLMDSFFLCLITTSMKNLTLHMT